MTDGRLAGKHELIAAGGRHLSGLSDQAQAIVRELMSAVRSTGVCWGDDEVGRSFAAAHAAHAAETLDRAGALPGRLTAVGGRFVDAAARLRELDEHGARAIRAAGEPTR